MVEETATPEVQPAEPAAPVVTPETPESAPSEPPAVVAPVESPTEAAKSTTVLGAEPPKEESKEPEKPVEVKPEDPKADPKPEEVKPEAAEKKDEASQSVEPAPLPSYEPFALPEDIAVDNERLGEFTKELGEFENLTKADHAEVQKFGQRLVERHIAEIQDTVKRLNESYARVWEKQKSDWKEAFVKDPEIGGNRQQTTVNSALEFIRTHGGTEVQQTEFRSLMDATGIGNHPAVIRLLANAMNAYREGKPVPATQPAKEQVSKIARRYGTI